MKIFSGFHVPSFGLIAALALGVVGQSTVADEATGTAVPAAAKAKTVKAVPRPRPGISPQDEQRFRGLAPEELNQSRSHDVVLDANGGFTGRLLSVTGEGLIPAADMKVKLLSRGQALAETSTAADGTFSVSGLKPGQVVAIFANGPSGLIVYGVRTVGQTDQNAVNPEVDVESAIVDLANVSVATELLGKSIGIRDLRFSGTVRESENRFPFAKGAPSTPISYDSVQIAADGKVYGQINLLDDRTGRVREVLSMRVFFLREGKVAAAGRVSAKGEFAVPGLEPGIHSVIGVGRDGIFALGIEVLPFKAAGKREDAVPVAMLVSMEVAVAPVTAQNINAGNFSSFFGQAPGVAPGVPGAPGTAPGGGAAPAAPNAGAPTGSGTAGGGAGGAGGGLGGAVAGGLAGALGGAVLGSLGDSTSVTPSP
ncbi:MAG: hypothetical protein ACKO2P_06650 [Planctomycetota bacterium]